MRENASGWNIGHYNSGTAETVQESGDPQFLEVGFRMTPNVEPIDDIARQGAMVAPGANVGSPQRISVGSNARFVETNRSWRFVL